MIGWLFMVGGAAAGVVQAVLLARDARAEPRPAAILVRLLAIGVVLFLAARSGHLLAGAASWALSFAASVALLRRGMR